MKKKINEFQLIVLLIGLVVLIGFLIFFSGQKRTNDLRIDINKMKLLEGKYNVLEDLHYSIVEDIDVFFIYVINQFIKEEKLEFTIKRILKEI